MAKQTTTKKNTQVSYREKPKKLLLIMDEGYELTKIRAILEKMLHKQMRYERATINGLKAMLKLWPKDEQPTMKAMVEQFIRSIE
jgi:hypothetical protein